MVAPGSAPCGTAPLAPVAGDCELQRGQAAGPLLTPVGTTPHLLDTCAATGGLPAPWGIPSRVPAAQWGGSHCGYALFAPSSVLASARWARSSASDCGLLINGGVAITVGLPRRGKAGARTVPLFSSRVLPPQSVPATPPLRLTTSRAASSVPRVGDARWTAATVAEPTQGAASDASVYCPHPPADEASTIDPQSVEGPAGSNGYTAAMVDVSDNRGGTCAQQE